MPPVNSLLSVIFNPAASTTVEDLQSPVLRRTMCSFLSLVSKTAAAKELQGTQAETPAKTLPTHLPLAPSTFSWPPLLLCSPGTLQERRTQVSQPFCWIISLFYTKQWQLSCLGSMISGTQTYLACFPFRDVGLLSVSPKKTKRKVLFCSAPIFFVSAYNDCWCPPSHCKHVLGKCSPRGTSADLWALHIWSLPLRGSKQGKGFTPAASALWRC